MKSAVAIAHNRDIENAVERALNLVEGLPALFEGRHVAIKPNDTCGPVGAIGVVSLTLDKSHNVIEMNLGARMGSDMNL